MGVLIEVRVCVGYRVDAHVSVITSDPLGWMPTYLNVACISVEPLCTHLKLASRNDAR